MQRRDFLKTTATTAAGFALSPSLRWASPRPAQPRQEEPFGLRYRQVHLDFHTSELLTPIAQQFDPEEFAATLKRASVNSVTAFGRCHHGMIYHDTAKFPERHHPGLSRNLLKEQIVACHRQDIRVPVYVTVEWDYYTAQHHPEWLCVDEHGKPFGTEPYQAGFYRRLDVASPYAEFLKAYLTELFEVVGEVDGLFFDITHAVENSAPRAIEAMRKRGLDPAKPEDRARHAAFVINEFKRDMTAFVRRLDRDCSVFYNSGHVGPYLRPTASAYTHLELESLPSGGWGYLHFPLTGRYARTLPNLDVLGMTGKFHTSWGDFHSLKNEAALQFEIFTMLALNAKCSIGDQLHPNGKLDPATYDLIGGVYGQVARKEPWCVGAKPVVDIAVFNAEEVFQRDPVNTGPRTPLMSMGAVRMLQEGKHQFDVVDSGADFTKYKVLILPDVVTFDATLKAKVEDFLAGGGAVLASHESGLTLDKKAFASPTFGLQFVGEAPFSPDFIVTTGSAIGQGLPPTELVMYQKGLEVKPTTATVLAQANVPFFNRTYEHFVSHRHTPSAGKAGYPAVTQAGRVVYFMHPIFSQYGQNAPSWCRKLVLNALDRLLPDPLVRTPGAPTTLMATLNEQPTRRVLHLLNYVPERRGADFDVLEDVIPLHNVAVSVKVDKKPASVKTAPEGQALRFAYANGRVTFTLPELRGHQMVAIG